MLTAAENKGSDGVDVARIHSGGFLPVWPVRSFAYHDIGLMFVGWCGSSKGIKTSGNVRPSDVPSTGAAALTTFYNGMLAQSFNVHDPLYCPEVSV